MTRSHAEKATSPRRTRVRTPTVLQMEAVECGAAALGIVLAHFGRWVPLEELREECGVSRDGSNAAAIVRAARGYGLTVAAYRADPVSIRRHRVPLIAFWDNNHFLVVEGWREGLWYLNDPVSGPRHVDEEEFARGFSGVVISCEPGEAFSRGGTRPRALPVLRENLGATRAAVSALVLAGLAVLVPGLAVPALFRAFVDGAILQANGDDVPVILIGLAVCFVLQLGLTWIQQTVAARMRTILTTRIFASQMQRILRLAMRFFAQRSPSDVAYRALMGSQIATLLSGSLMQALFSTLAGLVYLAVIVAWDPVLGLAVAVAAGVILLLLRWTARRQSDLGHRQQRDEIEARSVQASTVKLIESVKAGGGEISSFERISSARAGLVNTRAAQDAALAPLSATPAAVTSIATITILSVGAVHVLNGTISFGVLLAIQVLLGSVLSPLGLLVSLAGQAQQIQATLARLSDVARADLDPEIAQGLLRVHVREPPRPAPADGERSRLSGRLELRDVTFGFSPHLPPFIENLSLELRAGSRIALVGGSGSGKSTIGRLIVGLLHPWSGQVLLDGVPRAEWSRRAIADGLRFVDQRITIFEATVRDNLTLWDRAVPDAAVYRAASDALLHETVASRPGGYDAILSSGGRELSGGQRQRLELARAFIEDPALLVLDEATSALDVVTEREVMSAIDRRRASCVLIAHRLSTVRTADEIIVLDRGQVVERGSHDELLAERGAYWRLVSA
ncbi:MAG: cysteine peptidase family C39 domain-containing protein [Microbacterium sp.]